MNTQIDKEYDFYKFYKNDNPYKMHILKDTKKSQKKFIRKYIKYYQKTPEYIMSKNKIRYIINKVINKIEKSYKLFFDGDDLKYRCLFTSMTKSEITKYILENLNL